METIAMHFHCSEKMGQMLTLKAGDDAADVRWLEVGDHCETYTKLYASHKQIVDLVYLTHGCGPEPDGRRESFATLATITRDHGAVQQAMGESGRCVAISQGLQWAMCAMSGAGHEYIDGGLWASDVLDMSTVCTAEFRVASLAVALLLDAKDHKIDDVRRTTARMAPKLSLGDMGIAGNIFENLSAIHPWADLLPTLQMAMTLIRDTEWILPSDGSRHSPTLPTHHRAHLFRLDARTANALRVLCFVDKPPALTEKISVTNLRASELHDTSCSFRPTAVVLVGPPGSGKTHTLDIALSYLEAESGGPPPHAYARINPDRWITELCDNNNAYRNVANYCNHETFLQAVSGRRHLAFDGTGKSLINTCGRVIGRLANRGYRVHICVVLATHQTCWRRIESRRSETDRGVPLKYLHSAVKDLQRAIPTYIDGPTNGLCESTLVYDNDHDDGARTARGVHLIEPTLVAALRGRDQSARRTAVERTEQLLRLDPSDGQCGWSVSGP